MLFNTKSVLALMSLALFAACGSANMTGYYTGSTSGTVNNQSQPLAMTMTVSQKGSTISGDWCLTLSNTSSNCGTLSGGSFDGTTLSGLTLVAPPGQTCAGNLTAAATQSGSTLTGTITGTNNCGAASASLQITKQ